MLKQTSYVEAEQKVWYHSQFWTCFLSWA